jgi:hypothetical protein
MHISCSLYFYSYKRNERKREIKKSRLFFTCFILAPGNCSVDGYGEEGLIKFFLPISGISRLKIKKRGNKEKRMKWLKRRV